MNKIKERIKELEKGCGKEFKSFETGRVGVETKCGYQYRKHTLRHLCKECEAELKGFKEALKLKDEELKEKIDGLKVEKFKPIDEKDGFHMKGWNDALKELKQKIFSEEKA